MRRIEYKETHEDRTEEFKKLLDVLSGKEERADQLEALREFMRHKTSVETGFSDESVRYLTRFFQLMLEHHRADEPRTILGKALKPEEDDAAERALADTQQLIGALSALKAHELAITNQQIEQITHALQGAQLSPERRTQIVEGLRALKEAEPQD